jgi:hypothetical protein
MLLALAVSIIPYLLMLLSGWCRKIKDYAILINSIQNESSFVLRSNIDDLKS